jgi:hypothetical protein
MSAETKTYCLFEGRHEVPTNEGAIYEAFDFTAKAGIATQHWTDAIQHLANGGIVHLYVTGLTPALTEFLSYVKENFIAVDLVLLHHDRESNGYWSQAF